LNAIGGKQGAARTPLSLPNGETQGENRIATATATITVREQGLVRPVSTNPTGWQGKFDDFRTPETGK